MDLFTKVQFALLSLGKRNISFHNLCKIQNLKKSWREFEVGNWGRMNESPEQKEAEFCPLKRNEVETQPAQTSSLLCGGHHVKDETR